MLIRPTMDNPHLESHITYTPYMHIHIMYVYCTLRSQDLDVYLFEVFILYCCYNVIAYSIGSLTSLEVLNLSENSKLKRIPDSMCKLTSLKELDVVACTIRNTSQVCITVISYK